MSFIDIIKNLFCKKSAEKSEATAETKTLSEAEAPNVETPEKAASPAVEQEPVVETEPVSESEAAVEEVKPVETAVTAKQADSGSQIPEDSTLRRHYLANLEAEKQAAGETKSTVSVEPEAAPEIAEEVEVKSTENIEQAAEASNIPEDSTLKRHFIAALKAEIESGMPPRPSESTLKRHYDSTVQAEIEKRLG